VPTDETAIDTRLVVVVGLLAGALGGLFGVGGGLIIVPGLAVAVGLERRLAHGTSMAATLPIAVAGLGTYIANGNVDWVVGALMAIGTVSGAVIGTKLLTIVNKRALTIIFIVTVLATAIRLFLASETSGRGDISIASAVLLIVIGLATGTLSGLLGIGGGVVMVPAMIVLFGMTPVIAKGTSVAVIVPTALTGTIRNRKNHNVNFKVAGIAGGCGALTAIPGGMVADRLSDGFSNLMFATLLILVAATQLMTLHKRRSK
jgi:uncharacterized membrane protein YfcA